MDTENCSSVLAIFKTPLVTALTQGITEESTDYEIQRLDIHLQATDVCQNRKISSVSGFLGNLRTEIVEICCVEVRTHVLQITSIKEIMADLSVILLS